MMRVKTAVIAAALAALLSHSAAAEDLMDIYKAAFVRDPVILQQKAMRDAAFEKINEATAALLPQLDVIGSISTVSGRMGHGIESDRTNASGSLNLSQALWRHSAWANRSIAMKEAAKQDLTYNDALQNLIIRVANAYFNVLDAADTLTYAKANQQALKRQYEDARERFNVGLIAQTDELEAKAAYDMATTQVISAQNTLSNSYEEIRKLTGERTGSLNKLNEQRFAPQAVLRTLENLLKQAENNNLSLQASIIARDIAKENITLAQTGHEPTLDLNGSLSSAYTDYDNAALQQSQGGNVHEAMVGMQLNIPLYHGGATSSQVKQAEHNYIAASEAMEQTHREVVANVNSGYNDVTAAISSVRANEQAVTSAQSALDATRSGYEVGTRTITDVLDATQRLYNTKQALSSSRFNYIKSRLKLLYTDGTLKVSDLEAVNQGLKH